MQIRELRLNILFEYIKEIRRYTYDIQDFLQKNNLCDNVNIVPPIPDDIEPQIERLSTTKINEDKIINVLKMSSVIVQSYFKLKSVTPYNAYCVFNNSFTFVCCSFQFYAGNILCEQKFFSCISAGISN